MSGLQYRKQCCQKETERDHRVRRCVRSPHRSLNQLTDHETFVENLSRLSLRQSSSAAAAAQRSAAARRCCRTSACGAAKAPDPECAVRPCRRSVANTASKKNGEAGAKQTGEAATGAKQTAKPADSQLCYPLPRRPRSAVRCGANFVWQRGRYVRDDCGSGIVPLRVDTADPRRLWCKTPLTMYQSTIGELARQMLCEEIVVPKRVNDEPPCNLCERVMPLCKGYYRKYECRRRCEEDHAVWRDGRKVYRDAIQQYWMPCLTAEEKRAYDLAKDADHNVYLGKKLRRKIDDRLACW